MNMKLEISKGNAGRRRILLNGRRLFSFVWKFDFSFFRNRWLNRELKKILGTKVIHVIGDSHTHFFSGNEYIAPVPLVNDIQTCHAKLSSFSVFHLGPSLAYNTMKEQTTTRTREKINFLFFENYIPAGAFLLCVFGEIDLRVHVFRQVQRQSTSYRDVVNTILEQYCKFLVDLQENGFHVIVWGPIPTGDMRCSKREFSGTEVERNQATAYFNERLEKFCQAYRIGFISLYADLLSREYCTNFSYLSDGCHLSQKVWTYVLPKMRTLMAKNSIT